MVSHADGSTGVQGIRVRVTALGFVIVRTVASVMLASWASSECAQADVPAGFLGDGGAITSAEVVDGWIALFDGQTMFGWRPQPAANWRIEEGALVADAGDSCLLCTTTQFADYVLRVEFRGSPRTNSGLFLRTSPRPQNVTKDCYELNIAPPDNPFPTGSLVERHRFAEGPSDDAWHSFEITMLGGQVTVKLDERLVTTYADPRPTRRGYIGLQYREGPIAFRRIRLKPLTLGTIGSKETPSDGWRWPATT